MTTNVGVDIIRMSCGNNHFLQKSYLQFLVIINIHILLQVVTQDHKGIILCMWLHCNDVIHNIHK